MEVGTSDGYYALAGAIIRQAIIDYKIMRFISNGQSNMTKNTRKGLYLDAKEFLFTDRCEQFLNGLGLSHFVSIDAVRKEAQQSPTGMEGVFMRSQVSKRYRKRRQVTTW